jgi:ribosomal protein L12E/L44/L45/RPP1/RPP2
VKVFGNDTNDLMQAKEYLENPEAFAVAAAPAAAEAAPAAAEAAAEEKAEEKEESDDDMVRYSRSVKIKMVLTL